MTKEFDAAKEAFLRGDPRKLAEYVRSNALAPDQAEFVAMALSGAVEIKDGRSERVTTRNMYYSYCEIQIGGYLRKELFGNSAVLSKADVYRKLADLYGYSDEGTVKKAISRADSRRPGIIYNENGEHLECEHNDQALEEFISRAKWVVNQGRKYAMTFSEDQVRWMLKHWCGDTTDYPLSGDMVIEFDPYTCTSRNVIENGSEKAYAYGEINPDTGKRRVVVEMGSDKTYYDDPKITDEMIEKIRAHKDTIKK